MKKNVNLKLFYISTVEYKTQEQNQLRISGMSKSGLVSKMTVFTEVRVQHKYLGQSQTKHRAQYSARCGPYFLPLASFRSLF